MVKYVERRRNEVPFGIHPLFGSVRTADTSLRDWSCKDFSLWDWSTKWIIYSYSIIITSFLRHLTLARSASGIRNAPSEAGGKSLK